MPKTYGSVTERLLQLEKGRSFVVTTPRRVDYAAAKKHAPDREGVAESRDGGWVVKRVR